MTARPSRLERITNLVLALLDTARPLSLQEIGSQIAGYPTEPGALRQAFERDKRTLREGGIPIAVVRIDADEQVGYRILPEHYYLPELGLDPDEQAALGLALAAVRFDGGAGGGVAAKLGAPPPPDLRPLALLPSLPALGPLHDALARRARIRFTYHGRARQVAGYALVFTAGSWYFVGHDELAGAQGALRTFRVDRFEDTPVADEPGSYEIPADFDPSAEIRLLPGGGDGSTPAEATRVVLAVDGRDARAVLDRVGPDAIEARGEDGSLRLAFPVGDDEAFVSWVLGFADGVEVLEPARLRARVVERLEALAGPRGVSVPAAGGAR